MVSGTHHLSLVFLSANLKGSVGYQWYQASFSCFFFLIAQVEFPVSLDVCTVYVCSGVLCTNRWAFLVFGAIEMFDVVSRPIFDADSNPHHGLALRWCLWVENMGQFN